MNPTNKWITHRASFASRNGISALCYKRPMAIDATRASWALNRECVTCKKCLALLAQAEAPE